MVAAAVVGGAVIGGVMSSQAQKKAAQTAAGAQSEASEAGIAEHRRQFDSIQSLLKPYVDAGGPALYGQQSLIGLNGPQAQQGAISGIENSPEFAALTKQGESAILQNASATGGLRGGNIQSALAKFRPSLLSGLISQQFDRLGKVTALGQNSAVMQGNAGMGTGNNISSLLMQGGDAQAAAALASGRANAGLFNNIGSGLGLYSALGGFNSGFNPGGPTNTAGMTGGTF